MKVVLILDKDGNFDSFVYPGNKMPPFIPPPKRNELRDTALNKPRKKKKPQPL